MSKENVSIKNSEMIAVDFAIKSFRERKEQNGNFAYFEGYASVFGNIDSHRDVVVKGAFSETISSGKKVALLWQHDTDDIIGQIIKLTEDEKGLFIEGRINLGVTLAAEAYALLKAGDIDKMSIGYCVEECDYTKNDDSGEVVRLLTKINLWEISLVTFPSNEKAAVTDVKENGNKAILPVAAKGTAWDSHKAEARIRAWSGAEDAPNSKYAKAFLWHDSENVEEFSSFKLPIADVIDGDLVAIPKALISAAAAINGARGGVTIPENDVESVKDTLKKYYESLGMDVPFGKSAPTIRDVERLVINYYGTTQKDAKKIASEIIANQRDVAWQENKENDLKQRDVVDVVVLNKKLDELMMIQRLKSIENTHIGLQNHDNRTYYPEA